MLVHDPKTHHNYMRVWDQGSRAFSKVLGFTASSLNHHSTPTVPSVCQKWTLWSGVMPKCNPYSVPWIDF